MPDPQRSGQPPLHGIRVLAGSPHRSAACCADLLLSLGADLVHTGDADIVLSDPSAPRAAQTSRAVRCEVSAFGGDTPPGHMPEPLLQAWGGLMAMTGEADGPPCLVGFPVIETFAGINAATATLAALRTAEVGGPVQRVDTALADANAGLLGIFIGQVLAGKGKGYRDGCRHPICAPWNAYATRDGQVMLCTSSDAQWHRLLTLIGAEEAARDERFITMGARRRHVAEVDSLVTAWTAARTTAEAMRALSGATIPAGPIRSVQDMLAGPGRAWVQTVGSGRRCSSAFRLIPGPAGPARTAARGRLPLSGIRVLEVGPFTAGPLAGRLLAALGADVIKVEPPGGEDSRRWTPRLGDASLYFANYNVGKRSVVLDLTAAADRPVFEALLGAADVLLQNLKPGTLARLGYDPADLLERFPGLIACSISGFGSDASRDPALDTVIQAASGAMALVEHHGQPCKIGFSVADLMAGHLAPLGILACLRHRDRTGGGMHIDLAMQHALFWATQPAWDGPGLGPHTRVRAGDEWLVAAADGDEVMRCLGAHPGDMAADSMLARLRAAGIRAERVREIGEVFADPLLERRSMLRSVTAADGSRGALLGAPFGLSATPANEGAPIGPPDSGRADTLRDWLAGVDLPSAAPASARA